MVEIIALIIFLISFIGIAMIIIQKIPILEKLPAEKTKNKITLEELREKIKNNGTVSAEKVLHKLFSKIRILSLKTDNKTSNWLKRLREKSLQKKNNFSEDYWNKFKKK